MNLSLLHCTELQTAGPALVRALRTLLADASALDVYPQVHIEGKIQGEGPGEVHQPETREHLPQRNQAATSGEHAEAGGGLCQVDKGQADEDNGNGDVACTHENDDAQHGELRRRRSPSRHQAGHMNPHLC